MKKKKAPKALKAAMKRGAKGKALKAMRPAPKKGLQPDVNPFV